MKLNSHFADVYVPPPSADEDVVVKERAAAMLISAKAAGAMIELGVDPTSTSMMIHFGSGHELTIKWSLKEHDG